MIKPFRDLRPGTIFKPLKEEKIGERVVKAQGTFVKIGPSHSVNIADHKDAIFLGAMPCRIEKASVDTSHLPDWKIAKQGGKKHVSV